MVSQRKQDPYVAFNYVVEIEGLVVGGFSEVSGLQFEIEVEDYREGGVNEYIHKLAGPVRYPANLVLKRGMMDADDLAAWQDDVRRGVIEPRKVAVLVVDEAGNEARRWEFKNAIPVRWSGPELRAATSAVAVESLELVHQGLM